MPRALSDRMLHRDETWCRNCGIRRAAAQSAFCRIACERRYARRGVDPKALVGALCADDPGDAHFYGER